MKASRQDEGARISARGRGLSSSQSSSASPQTPRPDKLVPSASARGLSRAERGFSSDQRQTIHPSSPNCAPTPDGLQTEQTVEGD